MNSEKAKEQVMKAQGYAVEIEHSLRRVFECERFGFGGQINSDCIRKHPYLSMTQGLAYLYGLFSYKRNMIDCFNEKFSFYSEMSLDELLSFVSNEKTIGIATIQIDRANGVEQVEYMIEEFDKIVK